MRAARFHHYGPPEVLQIDETPIPPVAAGEVLLEVVATSFNPLDGAIRSGAFPRATGLDLPLPGTPGLDVAGRVIDVGAGVTGFEIGDAVVGYLPLTAPGAAAEYVVAPAAVLTRAPASIALEDAAALPLVGLTAWQAVFQHGGVESGQRVLVNGGGSAVGGHAVQLAVNAGADVVAIVGPQSLDRVRSYGPRVLERGSVALTRDSIGEFDVTINVAPTPFDELQDVTREAGRLISTTTPVVTENPKGLSALRMASRSDPAQLALLVDEVDAGRLRVWVADRRPITEIVAVHSARRGKTVLTPR